MNRSRKLLWPLLAMFLLLTSIVGPVLAVNTPAPNPDLAPQCALDVIFIIDESGSIARADKIPEVRAAAKQMVGALEGTGSYVAVVEFNLYGRRVDISGAAGSGDIGYQEVDAAYLANFNYYIDDTVGSVNGGPSDNRGYRPPPDGSDPPPYTNWEDAFIKATAIGPRISGKPPLVIMFTDGNPNKYIDENTGLFAPAAGEDRPTAADEAVGRANFLKGLGWHIFVPAYGEISDPNEPNQATYIQIVKDISGPDDLAAPTEFRKADFVIAADPADLAKALEEGLADLCAPSVTIKKLVNGPEGLVEAENWEFTATVENFQTDEASNDYEWTSPVSGLAANIGTSQVDTSDSDGNVHFAWTPNSVADPRPWDSLVSFDETAQPGYVLESVSCILKDNDVQTEDTVVPNATLPFGPYLLASNQYLVCTVTNTELGSITIVKDAIPADDTDFTFSQTIDGSGDFVLEDPNAPSKTFSDVMPGAYTVTEQSVSGWTLAQLVCDDGNSTTNLSQRRATINVEPGEDVTCTFTNARFSASFGSCYDEETGTFTLTVVNGSVPGNVGYDVAGEQGIQNLGFFNAGETKVFPGIPLLNNNNDTLRKQFSIDGGTTWFQRGGTHVFNPDNATRCPVPTGTIVIMKDAEPGDDTDFTFSQNIDGSGNFILEDPTTPSKTFNDVTPGTYTVTETVPNGWKLSEIECDDANSTTNTGQETATIRVEAGETVTCTFKNFKPLNLTSECSPSEDVRLWRVTNPNSGNVNYQVQGQTTTDATPNRVATPGLSYFQTVAIGGGNPNTTKIVYTDPFGNEQQVTKASNNQICPPPVGFCPVDDANVGNGMTMLIGRGMGSPTKAFKKTKLVVPDANNLTALYGQLAAVDVGVMKWVRFAQTGEPTIQINPPTSPAYRQWAVDWWGTELAPKSPVKAAFFVGPKAARAPRGLVLWPTYGTGEAQYANVFTTFDDSFTNHVYWSAGWVDEVVQTLDIPETQAAGAEITVHVALVDNQDDPRPVVLTVTPLPGGTPFELVLFGPNVPGKPKGWQNTLNLETIVLSEVPAGVNQIEIKLLSPQPFALIDDSPITGQGGDSVAMIGASAYYLCEEEDPR